MPTTSKQGNVPLASAFPKITIRTQTKRKTITYHQSFNVEADSFDEHSCRFIWPPLSELSYASQQAPVRRASIDELLCSLAIGTQLQSWADLVRVSIAEVTSALLQRCFVELEEAISKNEAIPPNRKARLAQAFRSFMYGRLMPVAHDERIARLRVRFQTTLPWHSRQRALISDIPRPGEAPLSAISHDSYESLRDQTKSKLEADIERVRAACRDILRRYELALTVIEQYLSLLVDENHESEIRRIAASKIPRRRPEPRPFRWPEQHLDALISIALRAERGICQRLPIQNSVIRGSRSAHDRLLSQLHGIRSGSGSFLNAAFLREAPPVDVLVACAILIQLHTGWNFSSVLDLNINDVAVKSLPHQLQATKQKTGDETPISFVEHVDLDTLKALSTLDQRTKALSASNLVKSEDLSLWLSANSILRGAPRDTSGWDTRLTHIQLRYELPKFSFDQLRTQVLAQVSLGPQGFAGAKRVAGHALSATTKRYVDQILLRRLNAANLYEFERRLDASIRYMLDPTAVEGQGRRIPFPIGDGSSCVAPEQPPVDAWLDNILGKCAGTECHNGEGCPVDSTRKLSQVSASILSHWFKGNFGYSNVDKSTSVSASWTPFLGFCRTDLVVRA